MQRPSPGWFLDPNEVCRDPRGPSGEVPRRPADLAAARYDRIARGNASPAQDDPIDHLDGSGEDQDRWEGVRGREGPEYFRHGGAGGPDGGQGMGLLIGR